jgi:rhamnulokinase
LIGSHLAIDLGAESGRAIVGCFEEQRLTWHELHRFSHASRPSAAGARWDLRALQEQVLECLRRGLTWARQQGRPLQSVGVDAWGVDFGLLDETGQPLDDPQCYRNPRNEAAAQLVLDKIGAERLYSLTGIQFMAINSLFQLQAQQLEDPSVLERAHSLLFIPDLLHHYLTGRKVAEVTIASTSQLLDPRSRSWLRSLLEELSLPHHFLPEIVPSGTDLGPLRPLVQDQVGVPCQDLRVVLPAAHDTACAVAAVPAVTDRPWCYLSSGTWSLIGAELPAPLLSDAAGEAPFTNEAGVEGTTRFLKNISGLWLVQECRRAWQEAGQEYDYAQLTELAASAPAHRTLLTPNAAAITEPGDMLEKITAFARRTNQPVPGSPGDFVRCCLESLALSYQHALDQMESILGTSFDVLHLVGGGSQNRLLNQMAADATGREVVVGPVEATAMGNLGVQAMGCGQLQNLSRLREIVHASCEPQVLAPRAEVAWTAAREKFLEVLALEDAESMEVGE